MTGSAWCQPVSIKANIERFKSRQKEKCELDAVRLGMYEVDKLVGESFWRGPPVITTPPTSRRDKQPCMAADSDNNN